MKHDCIFCITAPYVPGTVKELEAKMAGFQTAEALGNHIRQAHPKEAIVLAASIQANIMTASDRLAFTHALIQ